MKQRTGGRRAMNPTYGDEVDGYRQKVRAFLAEKLPSDWVGIGTLPNDGVASFVTEWNVGEHDLHDLDRLSLLNVNGPPTEAVVTHSTKKSGVPRASCYRPPPARSGEV